MYFSWRFLPTLLQARIFPSESLSILRIPQNPCPWTTFLCDLLEIPLKVRCYFQLKLVWPCSCWSYESSSSIFFFIHHPSYYTLSATGLWYHQQKKGIKAFWLLGLCRGSFPCMKHSDGLDPDGIRRLLHFVRLSQTLCGNLASLQDGSARLMCSITE